MTKRGRISEAEAGTNVVAGDFGRAEPPSDLNERQTEIWRTITAGEPVEFFNTAVLRGMLADLCRHREAGEKISAIIDSFQPEWMKNSDGAKRYYQLLKMRELETRASGLLATRLRLTNQSRYQPQRAQTMSNNTLKSPKPWEM
jgi:hypothetical protein